MDITLTLAYDRLDKIRKLFGEYTKMLVETDPIFSQYLVLQNYGSELEHPEIKYGLPDNRLYLAEVNGQTAGCIALRKLDKQRCEMKRLYVRPKFRGLRLGEHLVQQIIDDATQIGYQCMLLDTLPCLASAVTLYRTMGFQETERYNDSPEGDTLYMKLNLV